MHGLVPKNNGFRSYIWMQGSLLLIHRNILEEESSCGTKMVVAIIVKKAFDSVPHEVLMQGANQQGLRGRPLTSKSLLREWNYRVGVEPTLGSNKLNNRKF